MGRRRRDEDAGLLDDLAESLVALAFRYWIVVAVLAGLCLWVGVYYRWVNPGTAYGMGKYVGYLFLIVPASFGGVAIYGFVRDRGERGARAQRLEATVTVDDLRRLSWREFEQLVADVYRRRGFRVREKGGPLPDGGVDLDLTEAGKAGMEFLVQCKAWREWDVGEPRVREFFGAMAAWGTRCDGIFVTCGRFTGPARVFAEGKPIRLVDGEALVRLIGETNRLAPAVEHRVERERESAAAEPATARVPACPTCGTAMVRRVAGKGAKAGQAFRGCPRYPKCRGIVNIAR